MEPVTGTRVGETVRRPPPVFLLLLDGLRGVGLRG